MKIATVYTATTKELVELVNSELKSQLENQDVEVVHLENPEILKDTRENGAMTANGCRMLMELYEEARKQSADIIFNMCSSVGTFAQIAKPLYENLGIKFVRIDEKMAMQAVKDHNRIGVIATLPTTLEPTKQLLSACAAKQGREIVLVDGLADGAFGLNPDEFCEMLKTTGKTILKDVDCLLFAQGSMAYAKDEVSQSLNIPVFASVGYGVSDIKEIVIAMEKK